MTRMGGDRGSVTTETVIVAPVALALLCLIALVGRTTSVRDQVNEAARDAARTASIERDPASADAAARAAASTSLARTSTRCVSTTVDVDASAFRPGGQVSVTVSCTVSLADLGLLGVPGSSTIEARKVSVVDQYRSTP
jgi:Flp pilus assembly protein TadG